MEKGRSSETIHSPQDSSTSINNPHDKAFKLLFRDKRIAQDVIRVNLPDDMVANLNFTTMELVDGAFVSPNLRETFSDVLYEVQYGDVRMYISFLFEHKSSPDKFASFQVVQYINDLWRESMQEKNEIPVVVPIVFYHGLSPWNYEIDMRNLISSYETLPNYFKEHMPTMKYELIDMRAQDEAFIQLYEPLTRLVVLSFKNIFLRIEDLMEHFLHSLEELSNSMSEEELTYYGEIILLYFESGNRDFTEDHLHRKIKELEGKGEVVMTILERREKKGLEKGMREGIEKTARKLLSMGIDLDIVVEGTGLSLERVKELKAEINGECK